MQQILDKSILASRYILVVFYLGLAVALGFYALRFLAKLLSFGADLLSADESDYLLALLHLVDAALVASLVVMVALSSYDSLVSRLSEDAKEQQVEWVSSLDPGNLKIKIATAIVAISSIHLLQIFMKVETYSDRQIAWAMAIHGIFLTGALVLGTLDRLTAGAKARTKL
jgi:uncharacterized protein (TIGR00645 family)